MIRAIVLNTEYPVLRNYNNCNNLLYNFFLKDTTGKLLREDKHFSRSMNKELDLIFKSCSKRALLISKSWWACSASFNFLKGKGKIINQAAIYMIRYWLIWLGLIKICFEFRERKDIGLHRIQN